MVCSRPVKGTTADLHRIPSSARLAPHSPPRPPLTPITPKYDTSYLMSPHGVRIGCSCPCHGLAAEASGGRAAGSRSRQIVPAGSFAADSMWVLLVVVGRDVRSRPAAPRGHILSTWNVCKQDARTCNASRKLLTAQAHLVNLCPSYGTYRESG